MTELLNFVTECERIGDYAVNIKEKAQELADKEVAFSEMAQQELKLLDKALEKILTLTVDAFEADDGRMARPVRWSRWSRSSTSLWRSSAPSTSSV